MAEKLSGSWPSGQAIQQWLQAGRLGTQGGLLVGRLLFGAVGWRSFWVNMWREIFASFGVVGHR